MTAEEKAKELVEKFRKYSNAVYLPNDKFIYKPEIETESAKQCALLAVEEIINAKPSVDFWDISTGMERRSNEDYWQQVKTEIQNL